MNCNCCDYEDIVCSCEDCDKEYFEFYKWAVKHKQTLKPKKVNKILDNIIFNQNFKSI